MEATYYGSAERLPDDVDTVALVEPETRHMARVHETDVPRSDAEEAMLDSPYPVHLMAQDVVDEFVDEYDVIDDAGRDFDLVWG